MFPLIGFPLGSDNQYSEISYRFAGKSTSLSSIPTEDGSFGLCFRSFCVKEAPHVCRSGSSSEWCVYVLVLFLYSYFLCNIIDLYVPIRFIGMPCPGCRRTLGGFLQSIRVCRLEESNPWSGDRLFWSNILMGLIKVLINCERSWSLKNIYFFLLQTNPT